MNTCLMSDITNMAGSTCQESRQFFTTEAVRWRKLAKDASIKPEPKICKL